VQAFDFDEERQLLRLKAELEGGTYRPGAFQSLFHLLRKIPDELGREAGRFLRPGRRIDLLSRFHVQVDSEGQAVPSRKRTDSRDYHSTSIP